MNDDFLKDLQVSELASCNLATDDEDEATIRLKTRIGRWSRWVVRRTEGGDVVCV